MIPRPTPAEYAPYYESYIGKVPPGDIIDLLSSGVEETVRLLRDLSDHQAVFRYAKGKWSIKEIVGHLSDTERVYTYRALRFARNDPTVLPGFDQDKFVEEAAFDARPLADILNEFRAVRAASIAFFRRTLPATLLRRGTASGFEFTVRAIPYILAGHEIHHMGVIKERYLRVVEHPGFSK